MKRLTTLLAAFLFTTGMVFAQSNDADVSQTGYDNAAEVDQFGLENDVTLEQVHNHSNGTAGINDAYVKQTGNTNEATVYQRNRGQYAASGVNNNLNLIQTGFDNYANTYQAIARGNDIKLSQLGDDNIADIYQHQGGKLTGYGSAPRSVQIGGSNEIYLNMGNFNDAGISQTGGDNYADISQNSFSNDNVQLDQRGDANDMRLDQNDGNADVQQLGLGENILNGLAGIGTSASQSGGASMTVIQDGLANELFIGQDGLSTATVTQTGDLNTATVDQAGAHTTSVTQIGSGSTATVTQSN